MPEANGHPYEVFIEGETVDLVIPNEHAIEVDGWHTWFNDPRVYRFIDHGFFPNTKIKQYAWLETIRAASDRLDLLVLPKGAERVVGITSLSRINWVHRYAHHALILSPRSRGKGAMFHGLEAKALICEHGFEKLNLNRIWGGQVTGIRGWQDLIALFGFYPEGVTRKSFVRGSISYDQAQNACLVDEFRRIKEARGGAYWPGKGAILELIRRMPRESITQVVSEAIERAVSGYLAKMPLV
jgi:ribosomal-protein-alanine N-acetyltransferase